MSKKKTILSFKFSDNYLRYKLAGAILGGGFLFGLIFYDEWLAHVLIEQGINKDVQVLIAGLIALIIGLPIFYLIDKIFLNKKQ